MLCIITYTYVIYHWYEQMDSFCRETFAEVSLVVFSSSYLINVLFSHFFVYLSNLNPLNKGFSIIPLATSFNNSTVDYKES